MNCSKCNQCKYPQYCQYGVMATTVVLAYSTIRIIPKVFRYMKKKIFGETKENKYPNSVDPIVPSSTKTITTVSTTISVEPQAQNIQETKQSINENEETINDDNESEESNSDDLDRLKEIGSQIELNIVKKNRRRLQPSLNQDA